MDRIDETESLRLHQSGPATTSAWKTSPVESEDRTHIFHTNLAGVVAFAVFESCILVLVEWYKCRTMLPQARPFTSSPHLCCLLFHLPTISVLIFIARRTFPTILQWHPALGFSMRSHGCHIPAALSSTCTRKPNIPSSLVKIVRLPDLQSIGSTPPEYPPKPAGSLPVLEIPPGGCLTNQSPIYIRHSNAIMNFIDELCDNGYEGSPYLFPPCGAPIYSVRRGTSNCMPSPMNSLRTGTRCEHSAAEPEPYPSRLRLRR
jgi:hypothetical protein